MALPPQDPDMLQGHWTMVTASTGTFQQMHNGYGRTNSQVRYDNVAGSSNTTYVTHINETGGPGVVSVVGSNPVSNYAGDFRVTIDGVVLITRQLTAGTNCVGMAWLDDLAFGPLYFRSTFKLETRRWWSSYDYRWNAVYALLDWS